MKTGDIFFVLQWWLTFFILGLIFLPITTVFFHRFKDQGYIFAKSLGCIVFSYIVLLLGVSHLPVLGRIFLVALLVLLTFLSYGVSRKEKRLQIAPKKHLLKTVQTHWRLFLIEEVLFLLGIFFLAIIRSFQPDIHGLEKFMDYGFINSILRSSVLPAKDMWLTPFTINYYYFGHLVTALLIRLSAVPPQIGYNLMLASVFALCFVSSFSIGINLVSFMGRRVHWLKTGLIGLLAAFLVSLGGNLHPIYTLFTPYQTDTPVPPWELTFSPQTFPNSYWYPNATRFIHNTIHEFPIYSWTVSDLHGHVLDIPFVLLTIAFLFAFYLHLDETTDTPGTTLRSVLTFWKKEIGMLSSIGFLLAAMYMTNAWDGIIYLLLSGLIILFISLKRIWHVKGSFIDKLYTAFTDTLPPAIIIFACFIIFSLPFSLFFKPFVSGIGVLCAPQFLTNIGHIGPLLFEPNHCQKSPWWQLLILYGFFYFFALSLLLFLWKQKRRNQADGFVVLLIILSTVLIIIPEFIYIKDIYPQHYRANTMFKLVFQAFMMLAMVSVYTMYRIISFVHVPLPKQIFIHVLIARFGKFIWICAAVLLLIPVTIYPYFSFLSYYGNFQKYTGLDGTTYLKTLYPTDYDGIRWLNSHITGQPVILEAQGDSYTDYARISANTGLPTILGWTVHEWLWRGSYDISTPYHDPNKIYDVPAPRIAEVQTLYETNDIQETKRLLKKYHVQLVFIGSMEFQKYPALNEEKFKQLGKILYHNGTTTIYEIQKV